MSTILESIRRQVSELRAKDLTPGAVVVSSAAYVRLAAESGMHRPQDAWGMPLYRVEHPLLRGDHVLVVAKVPVQRANLLLGDTGDLDMSAPCLFCDGAGDTEDGWCQECDGAGFYKKEAGLDFPQGPSKEKHS